MPDNALAVLNQQITECGKCPRLVNYREQVAREKRRAFLDWTYWGRPVPGFGDPRAKLLIVGLAPGAHGANRTGRMFTGDRSGDFLYQHLFEAGFANQPVSRSRDDGLRLRKAFITASLRCAPPRNTPLPSELENCRPYLVEELTQIRPRVVLALGKIGFDAYLRALVTQGLLPRRHRFRFRHGAKYRLPGDLPVLFAAFHPSRQNTQTGRLTPSMYRRVFRRIQRELSRLKA